MPNVNVKARPEVVPVLHKYHSSPSDIPSLPEQIQAIANTWIAQFGTALASGSVDQVISLLIPDTPIWRDLLVFTWTLRTLIGVDNVCSFLKEHLSPNVFTKFAPSSIPTHTMEYGDDVSWINAFASFETSLLHGTSVIHLIPTRAEADGEVQWKAQGVMMDTDEIKGHPALVGEHRKQEPVLGGWEEALAQETKFENNDPTVVIIGGSQAGLVVAARLKTLGIQSLVIERTARIGDMWRNRYDALSLHDPVWYDHMPFLPFPPTWPAFTPAKKLANWLESYASILELPVRLSTMATKVYREDGQDGWRIDIDSGGEKSTLTTRHVVFALGHGAGIPTFPEYPGMKDTFAGEILHSSAHKTAANHIGKKVVVIGSSTSSHDVCLDLAKHDIDVTMVQRGPTHVMSNASLRRTLGLYREGGLPTDVADLVNASMWGHLALALAPRVTTINKEADKELLSALEARGQRLYYGPDATGFTGLLYDRGGGYYFDTGASGMIVEGRIKVKSDAAIVRFDAHELVFADDSRVAADVVICATGFESARRGVEQLLPPKDCEGLRAPWSFDEEGEIGCIWRESGVQGLHVMMGNLAMGRYYSKHLTLRIKAMELGLIRA